MLDRLPAPVAPNADWLRSPRTRAVACCGALALIAGFMVSAGNGSAALRNPAGALSWVVPLATGATQELAESLSETAVPLSIQALPDRLRSIGFQLDHVREGRADVPRWFVESIPHDMPDTTAGEQRKGMFISMMLPHVLYANELIMADRERLLQIAESDEPSAADRVWLAALADEYGVDPSDIGELKRRVDIVPPSLALAQAAEESGWGTSRYALNLNNVFGQYKPVDKPGGPAQVIRPFDALDAAVQGYMYNLNTHRAYGTFRKKRERARLDGRDIGGRLLAPALTRYSERGVDYTRAITGIIRSNKLEHFDKAKLGYTALSSSKG